MGDQQPPASPPAPIEGGRHGFRMQARGLGRMEARIARERREAGEAPRFAGLETSQHVDITPVDERSRPQLTRLGRTVELVWRRSGRAPR